MHVFSRHWRVHSGRVQLRVTCYLLFRGERGRKYGGLRNSTQPNDSSPLSQLSFLFLSFFISPPLKSPFFLSALLLPPLSVFIQKAPPFLKAVSDYTYGCQRKNLNLSYNYSYSMCVFQLIEVRGWKMSRWWCNCARVLQRVYISRSTRTTLSFRVQTCLRAQYIFYFLSL